MSENTTAHFNRILSDLIKTIKVVSVYPENNPIPTKLKESFIDRFSDLIRQHKTLKFQVTRDALYFNGEKVFQDNSSEETLAGLFFNTGITEISFNEVFSTNEANLFFKIIKGHINREEGCDDLVAQLWQAEIGGFAYKTIEDTALGAYEGRLIMQDDEEDARLSADYSGDSGKIHYSEIFFDDDEKKNNNTAAGAINSDHLAEQQMGLQAETDSSGPTVPVELASVLMHAYTLDAEETSAIENLLKANEIFDIYGSTADLLREILFHEDNYEGFAETITIFEKTHGEFIDNGRIRSAGQLLSYLLEASIILESRSPLWKERVASALVMAGGWEAIARLGRTLNRDESILSEEIIAYLNNFGWQSLSAVVDLLGTLEHKNHRLAVCDYLKKSGREHVDIIVKGIYDKRWFVVRNIIDILADIGGKKAAGYLLKAVNHDEIRVRQNLINALKAHPGDDNIAIYVKFIWDTEESIRASAVEAVLGLTGSRALNALVEIINDDRFSALPAEYQKQLILSFSIHGKESAVEFLGSLIEDSRRTAGPAKDFYQRVAFAALAVNRSEKAGNVLEKFSKSWNKQVRAYAREAIDRRRESGNEK